MHFRDFATRKQGCEVAAARVRRYASRVRLALLVLAACVSQPEKAEAERAMRGSSVGTDASPQPTSTATGTAMAPPKSPLPWLSRVDSAPVDVLASRFVAPTGTQRVPLPQEAFGTFLRGLPLLPPGSPVRSFKRETVRAGDHPRVAAVVALDLGPFDVQQCADTIVRLHAEWQFAQGNHAQTYKASSGFAMDLSRWEAGERLHAEGNTLTWVHSAKADTSWNSFRSYLDRVFTFTNTVALARDARKVKPDELAPGDFFVQAGFPGHAVIVLDLAKDASGKRFALLGQGFMPAQDLHVLRSERDETWFPLDAFPEVHTPFWAPFAWSDLRRM